MTHKSPGKENPALPASLAAAALALAGAIFPATHGASSAQEATRIDIVPTRTDRHERLTVPVRIGERGTYRFLIDTGSQNTVLSATLADALALERGKRARVVSLAGSRIAQTVVLDEIGLGRRAFYGLVAPLLDAADIGADGILGVDSLQDQRVLIDFAGGRIAIDEARYLGGNSGFEIVVRARRQSGQLIMTDAEIDGIKVNVVIDTGAEASIGNRALQNALARSRESRRQAVLTSVTGDEVLADLGTTRRLTVGGIDLDNVVLAYTDSPAFAVLKLDKRPAMLLGMRELRAFNRVAIDFSTRKVLFDVPR